MLNSFTAGFMEGSVKGRASVDANVKPPELTAGIMFDGVKLQRLFEGSKLFGNRLFGNVGGSANITLNLRRTCWIQSGERPNSRLTGARSPTGISERTGDLAR